MGPQLLYVDTCPALAKNINMAAGFITIDKDLGEVIRLVTSKTKDSDALCRARERADKIREEMKAKYGTLNVAVELVQEARDCK